ncbi:TPA: hypothetical protein DCZ36_00620 [Candidatus Gracilibacteria bacterium]|nr:hypothetical protein [Candidatus Gracilibacteria bacterium]
MRNKSEQGSGNEKGTYKILAFPSSFARGFQEAINRRFQTEGSELLISDVSGKTSEILHCSKEHDGSPFQELIEQRNRERKRILAHDFLKNIKN